MSTDAALTPREVAELSGAPKRVIEKAIEERVLRVILTKLDLRLSAAHKKRLLLELIRIRPSAMNRARIELAPAVEIDVGWLVGDAMSRAERYWTTRDSWIVIDEKITGGTPVIRGTGMTVYSLLGRIEHGDGIDEVLADNPDLKHQAIEAAIIFARTHPPMGRPSGRPWADVA